MALSRRSLLSFLAAAGATVGVGARLALSASATELYDGRAVVDGPMLVDRDWTVTGVTIVAGGVLEFDPSRSVTLRSTGSVVVRGTLRMRPNTAGQVHRLQFVNVNEVAFLGGAGGPDTDVGLWFYDMGMADLCGTDRVGWNRTGTDPSWLPGDEIRVAPSDSMDFTSFPLWAGGTAPSYKGQSTEVFNLTRNVIIGGTATGRSHVMFMMAMAPQMICHVRFEHVGPRQVKPENTAKTVPVLGRYGCHFHKCGDASRGTVVEGCVVVNAGSRGFVPHASHGVTFRDCVTYATVGRAYWWDEDDKDTDRANMTNDVFYDRCAAFKVAHNLKAERGQEGKLTAFLLGQGTGNKAYGCVAVGVWTDGAADASGFYWDENANQEPNVWDIRDCVAHNNEVDGFFAWQNDPGLTKHHVVTGLSAWRNGEAGVDHGAYIQNYQYLAGGFLGGNGRNKDKSCQLHIHPGLVDVFEGFTLDADGRSQNCVLVEFHQAPIKDSPPLVVRNVSMTGHTDRAVRYSGDGFPGGIDWVDCTVNGADLEPSDFRLELVDPAEQIRVQRRDGTAYRLWPNGAVVAISSFA